MAFRLAEEQCVELHGRGFIAEQLHPRLSVGCSGVKNTATGLERTGDVISGATNHTSLANRWTSLSLAVTRRARLCCAECEVCWRGITVGGCVSGVGLGPVVPVKGTINASAWTISCAQICGNSLWMTTSCSNMTAHQHTMLHKDLSERVWCGGT